MEFNWMEFLPQLFELILFPLLMVLTAFIIKWFYVKEKEITSQMDDETAKKYTSMLFETIRDCVSATTQTYVEGLKKQGKFDEEAQKIAFQMSMDAVLAVLTDDAKEYLTNAFGDLDAYLTTKIEAEVKAQK